ncbi:helix-turn-helix transcriptional regulator [Arthrobacter dokdonensis]|uniref:helix-turn-helix transcriptional regulator n=1 Tax=Arthrobacter dokdonellae TaxID=2211210 RepID=UPI000DE59344|nr:LuxR family transcriptional regulator [Arthrobacter dokdonellae]
MTGPTGPPEQPWELHKPPFCRANELADIVSAIRSEGCRAVFVTSDNGFGASTILRELTEAAQEHVPVLTVHGSQSLAKIPFGVMAPYLSAAGTEGASIRMDVLRAVLDELRLRQEALDDGREGPAHDGTEGPAHPGPESPAHPDPAGKAAIPAADDGHYVVQDLPLMVVDDAHSMDTATAELIVSLVRSGIVNLVASHSSRHGLPDPLPKLWATGMAENIVLRPLDQAQARDFCETMLGGPVLESTGWHFWSASGGNPLFLQMLVTQAVQRRTLTKRWGVWVADPTTPVHGNDLKQAVRSQLRDLSEAGSEALNLIALSEPVEDSSIEELVGTAALRELLDWRLVRYGPRPSRLLRLANPIYGEVVREMVSVTQSRLLHERLIGRLGNDPANKEGLLRRVVWAVEIGVDVPDERLLAVAVLASRMYQSNTALELANLVGGKEFRLRADMVRARAHYNLGNYQRALSIVDSVVQDAGNLPDLLFGTLLRATTRSALGMPVESLEADAAVLRRRGVELARSHPGEAESIHALSESGALLVDLMALSRRGRFSAMACPIALLTEVDGLSDPMARLFRAMALTMESERLSAQGFPEQGMARAREAYAIEHSEENDVFFLPESILLRHLAAAVCCGDWQGAANVMAEFSLEAGPVVFSFGGGADVVRGMVFLRGGKAADALPVLLAGIDALRISDSQQLLGFCTAMAAYAAARLGKVELARRLVDDHVEGAGMFVVLSHERAYMAAAQFLLRHDAGTPVELVALADSALAEGSTTLELNALAMALELGDEGVVPRLARVAARVEGQWARALRQYAEALGAQDGERLSVAGEALGAAGMFGLAERALQRSVALLGESESLEAVRSARSSLRKAADGMGVETPGMVRPAKAADTRPPTGRLTRREMEISTMAAAGRTDREIAQQLMLSLRTVEGHLYRAYAKLGISGREELAGVISGTATE